jgi:hypothetical protein
MSIDFQTISKAIAGGISGAVTATAGGGAIYFSLPAGTLPANQTTIVLIVNAVIGFAVGFLAVYHAPQNTAPKP